jgi:hypothetical protein
VYGFHDWFLNVIQRYGAETRSEQRMVTRCHVLALKPPGMYGSSGFCGSLSSPMYIEGMSAGTVVGPGEMSNCSVVNVPIGNGG